MCPKVKTRNLYFIAIVPPEPLKTDAQKIKEDFAAEYGTSIGLKSPPHITLIAPFTTDQDTVSEVIELLNRFAQTSGGFPLHIDGFDHFNKKVIFLKPVTNRPLSALWRRLNVEFYKHFSGREQPSHSFRPHMTIAYRDLSPEVFDLSWEIYREKPFIAQCMIDRLFLLRHNRETWVELKAFPFGQLQLPI